MRVTAIALVVFALGCATASAQEFAVYKWVDEDGVPQYTDRPPANEEATRTGIRSRRTDPSAVMARAEQQSEQRADQNAARQDAADAENNAAAERAQTRAEREEKCQRARERAETYNTARRLYRPLADGSREYLTDQELSEARATADEAVNTWCN